MADSLRFRPVPRRAWIVVSVFLCALWMASPAQAKNNCPWINEATASGLLGGDAVGEFTEAASGQPAVCLFTMKDASTIRTLRVAVEVTPEFRAALGTASKACGPDASPIQAIGNEATMCATDDRQGPLGERVVGRVRDQIFTITMSSSAKGDLLLTRPNLKIKIYTAAEQVAGNLF